MAHVNELKTPYTVARAALLAADTTRTLVAAPQAGVRIRVFRVRYSSVTSAAQAVAVAAGSTTVLNLGASVLAGLTPGTGWLEGGLLMPAATALIATPAAAGPAGDFYITYMLE